MRALRRFLIVVCTSLPALEAAAETDVAPPPAVDDAVRSGVSLPLGLPATRRDLRAAVSGFGGYDAARDGALGEAQTALRVSGPLSIHGGAVYSQTADRLRPSLGAMVELLDQPAHGVDAAFSLTYRPEGFNEPEGEIEACLGLGRRLGRGGALLGSVTYGQDPEGRERDAELRMAGLVRIGNRLLAGGDSRARIALSRPDGSMEPDYDVVAGPVGVLVIDQFAITGQVGASVIKVASTEAGAIGLVGVTRVF